MSDTLKLDRCLACDGANLTPILDLGIHPLANSFLKNPTDVEGKYPLAITTCGDCFHTQLTHAVNPDLMFKDYLYVSGTSQTLKDYMDWFAKFSVEEFVRRAADFGFLGSFNILDIACNDGTQLDAYVKLDHDVTTYGVDPAENLYQITKDKHSVVCDYLNDKSRKELMDRSDGFDIINAQNVFAHNSNPYMFMKHCAELLTHDGLLFIQNSQADMIKNGEFDTIYHEHISFWNANSINKCAQRAGLILCDRIRVPVHGISDLFIFRKRIGSDEVLDSRAMNVLSVEKQAGLHDMKTYHEFGDKARSIIQTAQNYQNRKTDKSTLLVGVGAAAKGMTFLNATGLKPDFIIDENPLKIGLYSPGLHVPVVGMELIKENENYDFVILAWNFRDEIKSKLRNKNPGSSSSITFMPQYNCDSL